MIGGGVNAFSEYERGVRQPAKSTVLLLKLLDQHPDLLPEVLAAGRTKKSTVRRDSAKHGRP